MSGRHGVLTAAVASLAVLFLTGGASAQVQTGSILVRAADEQGAVVPGASVTITSTALVTGQMTGVTDAGGMYRFPSLTPGTYTVKLELEGFQTVIRENIIVNVGQTVPVDIPLKVASVAETVTVSGAAPIVDTTNANVSVLLSQPLLQSTPGGRDIWALVEYKVPGLISSRPDVGGTSGGLQGAMVARGTSNAQNSQFLNGINVGDPAAIGYSGYYYDYDAFDEVQVSTGAHDISVPGSGVFVNMTTKTGGDKWSGRTSFFWQGDSTQARNVDSRLGALGFKPDTNKVDFVSDLGFQLGGPLVRNKVRLFSSFRDWRVHVNVPAAFSESVLDETNMTSGLVNVTWQVSGANRITGFYTRQYYKKPNRFLGSSANYTSESNSNEDDIFDIVQGLWNSVISDRFFMDARISYNKIFFPLYYNGKDQALTDLSTGILLRNELSEQIYIRHRLQTSATFNYYIDRALGGRHEIRFGIDHAHMPTSTEVHRWDDLTLTYRSATNQPVAVTFYNTPVQSKATVDVTALFLQDSYTLKRLTLTGGLRWERVEAYLPAQSSPPSRWFPDIQRKFDAVHDSPLWHTAGPRIAGVYDVDGGRTALKFSAGRYYYIIGPGTANNINPNFSVSRQYAWNDANGDLRYQVGEETGVPVQAGGLTTSFDPDFRRPYTNEVTAGLDRELLPDLRFSTVFTWRSERYQQASLNTAAPLDTWVLVSRFDPGPDGLTGTNDDGTYSYYDRTLAGTQTLITNDLTARQTYKGVEITATKRMSRRWQMLAGYTYSVTEQRDLSVATSPNAFLNTEGRVFNDRPHQLKITGSYVLPYDIYVGANYRFQNGPPINRTISAPLSFGGGSTTVNVEPPASHRLPSLQTFALRVAKTFRVGANRTVEVDVDIDNLTNANTVWEQRSLTGRLNVRRDGSPTGELINIQQFLSPTQILAPRIIRFGAAFRF
ncbi:MAG: carboxypeptidase regulatory-like domain-containing protein [Vicinamibacterales bacterium]